MQIDRARFLLLTASLAGGSCTPTQPAALPLPEPAATGTEVTVPEIPEPEESADPVATAPSSTPSAAPSVASTQPPSGACDNDTGTVPACSVSSPPGPSCESFSDTKASCKGYKSALRSGVAAKAVACLNKVSGTQAVCDYTITETCSMEAVRGACIQPSTFNACSPVVSACAANSWNRLDMQDCQALLSAVKDGKRAAMMTCMAEGCSISACSWSLR